MRLLNIQQSTIEAAPAQTLDQLWYEAEQLGTVKVDSGWSHGLYDVTITFKRKSGTRILAAGKDKNIHFAMAAAINEAREMGAGVDQ